MWWTFNVSYNDYILLWLSCLSLRENCNQTLKKEKEKQEKQEKKEEKERKII